MKIYICDDEVKMAEDFAAEIHRKLPEGEITCFSRGMDVLAALRKEVCDVLFLDIDMPEITGMDIAAGLSVFSKKPLLVFVTSHDELVYDSLRFHPFGFLRKNSVAQELDDILADCKEAINSQRAYFCFRTNAGKVKLSLTEILYFEADGNYLMLKAKDENYRFRETLSGVENALSEQGFVRIHKGFLVNQQAVRLLGAEELELTDGSRVPLGRSYSEEAKKRILRYMV